MIDASCWLTAFDQKNTVYHLSNRYTSSGVARADMKGNMRSWHLTTERVEVARSYIGSKQRTWEEPSFDVGTFLSSLNRFISQNLGGRRSMKPVLDFNAIKSCCYPQTSGFKHGQAAIYVRAVFYKLAQGCIHWVPLLCGNLEHLTQYIGTW